MTNKKFKDQDLVDLADGKIKGAKAKEILSFIQNNKKARIKYSYFLKTSIFEGFLEESESEGMPLDLKNKIQKSIINQKLNRDNSFFIKSKEWIENYFSPRIILACSICLIIGYGSGNFNYRDSADNQRLIFRSGIESKNEIFDYLDIFIEGEKPIDYGGYLKNGEEFKVFVTAKESGFLKINFPDDRLEFSSNIKKNEKIKFPGNELTFEASRPSIFFEIEFKTSKKIHSSEFKFLVE